MPHTSYSTLFASCRSVVDAAGRSLAIARALAEGYREGLRPPDDILEAYFARIERDEAELSSLRQRLAELTSGDEVCAT
jgi:hypothetical protein